MIPADLTIPKGRETEPALDHRQLQALGLSYVQRLAYRLWTDHNLHDPGITTLELLGYALTDLAYRASFPVEELLAAPTDNEAAMKEQFFTAREIMTTRPLNKGDYRKLLIDLEGVKNAWLHQHLPSTIYLDRELWELGTKPPAHPAYDAVTVNGRYNVLVDLDDTITGLGVRARKKATQQVLDEVQRVLNANRSLCQEFVRFDVVKSQDFMLCGKIELTPEADTPQVQAELQFRIQRYLAPAVRRYTLAEMLEKKRSDGSVYTADAIFEGPRLTGGFIDDEELEQAELRKEILLSDVICIIMDIPGVLAVREIMIRPAGTGKPSGKERWRVPVAPGKKGVLAAAPVTFYKRNMPLQPDPAEVERRLHALEVVALQVEERILREDFPIPLGQYRDVGDYYSFQNHFPALYGLSEAGLDATADDRRRAQAFQLKGYLLFFDQIMSDYLAQLRHIPALLSVNTHRRRTYFSSLVDSFREYRKIYSVPDLPKIPGEKEEHRHQRELTALGEELARIADPDGSKGERRNRFLDHLLARFGERFTEYAHLMYTLFGADGRHIIPHKQRFLAACPSTGSERGLAFDYFRKEERALWDTDNVSGYERRLCLLLGLDPRRRNLSVETLDTHAEVTTNPDGTFGFRILNRENGREQLLSAVTYASRAVAEESLRRAIRYGKFGSHYRPHTFKSGKNRCSFQVVDDHNQPLANAGHPYDYPHTAREAGAALAEYLREQYPDEGMYVIENLLLLPERDGDPFLPVCPADGLEPEDKDPYSWRIHVVLPGYTSRFADLSFRRYAEQVIREETPAHILPKVCWIGREHMQWLEAAYREWLLLKGGADTTDRQQKLLKLIYTLQDAKNIYPPQKLHCGRPGDEQSKFLLNRSCLGTGEKT